MDDPTTPVDDQADQDGEEVPAEGTTGEGMKEEAPAEGGDAGDASEESGEEEAPAAEQGTPGRPAESDEDSAQ